MQIGDIYWTKSNDKINHPQVIIKIEGDILHVVSLTTNMKKISMPRIIVLDKGEGNLEKQSIVEVYKVKTISLSDLEDYIGTLSASRVEEIKKGIGLIERSFLK